MFSYNNQVPQPQQIFNYNNPIPQQQQKKQFIPLIIPAQPTIPAPIIKQPIQPTPLISNSQQQQPQSNLFVPTNQTTIIISADSIISRS